MFIPWTNVFAKYDEALGKAQEAAIKQVGVDKELHNLQVYILNKTDFKNEINLLGTALHIYKSKSILIPLNKNNKLQIYNNGVNIILTL